MFRTDIYGMPPGITGAAETYEAAFRWGQYGVGIITGALIDAACIDPTNVPTFELRPGLVLGKKSTTGTWTNYAATNTDGSGIAAGILMSAVRMQDFQGATQQRFYGILVGGPVQAGKLLGLDYMARQQMRYFQFDTDLNGFSWFPYKQIKTVTTGYTALVTDNMTLFDNLGAGGAVTITLPAIANGLMFGIHVSADQTMTIASAEGSNIVALNNASASSLAFSTGIQKIGGAISSISIPSWLQGHSPPPMAEWFSSIGAAAESATFAGLFGSSPPPCIA